jgi:hypothetical protein
MRERERERGDKMYKKGKIKKKRDKKLCRRTEWERCKEYKKMNIQSICAYVDCRRRKLEKRGKMATVIERKKLNKSTERERERDMIKNMYANCVVCILNSILRFIVNSI